MPTSQSERTPVARCHSRVRGAHTAYRTATTTRRRNGLVRSLTVPSNMPHLLATQASRGKGAARSDMVEPRTIETAPDQIHRNRPAGRRATGVALLRPEMPLTDDKPKTLLIHKRDHPQSSRESFDQVRGSQLGQPPCVGHETT
jgi:hypothetical protein